MARRKNVDVTGESDITPKWLPDETRLVTAIQRRYMAAGAPQEWLQAWLDDVQHETDRDRSFLERVIDLPWIWKVELEKELNDLLEAMRPPGAEGEFE